MILPDFILSTRQNLTENFSGIDSFDKCLDQDYFKKYPHLVEYNFNNRGFRDANWPNSIEELKNAIWCFGDSFTVGLGSPINNTWPYLLQKKMLQRCINVSMDGASNNWIARKVLRVLNEIKPKRVVIHWSYITRYESTDESLTDEDRRKHHGPNLFNTDALIEDFHNLIKQIESNKGETLVIYSFIPDWCTIVDSNINQDGWNDMRGESWPALYPVSRNDYEQLPETVRNEIDSFGMSKTFENFYSMTDRVCAPMQELPFISEFAKFDLARDGLHYDIKTADYFSNKVIDLFNSASSDSEA